MSWTISGSVQQLAPIVYDKIMRDSTDNDTFAMAPSGYGYVIPSKYSDIESFGINTAHSIGTSSGILENVNVIDDWNQKDSYSSTIDEMLDAAGGVIKSILYYFGDAYCGGHGKISWHKDYPIITGKEALWDGWNDYSQIADKLNSYPVDPTTETGYSLIPVQVWSNNLLNVSKCIALLNDHVKVVGIDEFVDNIIQNVKH